MTRLFCLALFAVALVGVAPTCRADFITYVATLNGASESPPNASPGTGSAEVDFDSVAHTMRVQVTFAGLLAATTAAHIHAPTATPGSGTAGVATQTPYFVGFPIGATSGTYDHTFDTSLSTTYNSSFITANGGTVAGAEAALAANLADGKAYLNIHTSLFPAGEIRGFLEPEAQPVPEPSSLVLLGTGTLGLLGLRLATGRRNRPFVVRLLHLTRVWIPRNR